VFKDTTEVGAVAEFMTSGLKSGLSGIVPEARLDYVEGIMKFGLWSDAIEAIDVFERRLAPNDRSRLLRIEVYIGAGEFDKAAKGLAARPENDPNTIRLSLAMVESKIKQTQLSIARLENKEFLDVAFGGIVMGADDESATGSLEAMRKELDGYLDMKDQLVEKLLVASPDLLKVSSVLGCAKHHVKKGNVAKAKRLIEQYLGHSPDDTDALVYRQVLNEREPGSVTKARILELEEKVLSNISDPAERALQLGVFYRGQKRYDEALKSMKTALKAQGPQKPTTTWYYQAEEEQSPRYLAVGHLFDIAIHEKNWTVAQEAVDIAREEDLDGCEGNVFAARLAFARGQNEEAKTRIDEALRQRPIFARAYSLRSNINAALGDDHAAIEDVKHATQLNQLDGLIAKGYAQLLHLRNTKLGDRVTSEQITETRRALQRAMALNPGDTDLRRFYAEFIAPTEPLKALAILQAFHKSEPTFETSISVGQLATRIAREETNDQRKAVLFSVAGSALEYARKIRPDDKVMLYHYAEYLRAMGRDSEAVPMLTQSNQMDLLWNHYYQRGQYDEAKSSLEKLYETDRGNAQIIKGLVLVAEKTSDTDATVKYTDELIAADPNIDSYLIQIQSYLRVGLVKEAATKLQSFNEKHPEEPRTLLLRAWLEMRKGQLQAALELTNRFLESNPTNAVGWRLRGEIRYYEGEIIKAIDDLKKSKSFKDEAATRVVLAKAYLRASRFEDAVTELKNAIDSPGVPMEARLLLEETYKQLDRKEALGEFYAATINEFPTSVFWLNRAGLYALEMADYSKAAQLYSNSFELKRQEYATLPAEEMQFDAQYASAFDGYLRSNILLAGLPKTKDWKPEKLDEVFEFAKQYLDTHYSPLAYLRMAQAKLLLGHKRTAVEYCQKAVNESEDNEALASEVLLRMFLLLGPEEVSKYCLEKLKKDPDSIPANFTMFNLYKVNREYLKALPYIVKCIELTDPDNRKHLDYSVKKAEILTLAYQRSSDNKYLKMAIADYKSLLEKMPNNTSVLNNLAYMLAEGDENIGDALKYAEKVYSLSPNDPGVLDTYGYVLYKNGKYTEALGHLNAALQYYGQNELYIGWEVYEHLGLIKQALGDEFGAVMAYEQAKKVGGVSMSNKDLERINKALESLSSK
jgi:tetratricopeptide (TPR) repeat protein